MFLFSLSSLFHYSEFTNNGQVPTILKIHFMNHDTILSSLPAASALSMVLCNQISILTFTWKAKISAFPSDLVCFHMSVECELQPTSYWKSLPSWPLWYFSYISYLYTSFTIFVICFSSCSPINNIHRYLFSKCPYMTMEAFLSFVS